MTIAPHISLVICAVLLHTWCQGTVFHHSPLQMPGKNRSAEGSPCFHIFNRLPQSTPSAVIQHYCILPTRLERSICSFTSDSHSPPLPCFSNPTSPPFLHFDAGIICQHKGESTRPPGSCGEMGAGQYRKRCIAWRRKSSFSRHSAFKRMVVFWGSRDLWGMYRHTFLGQESPYCLSLTTCHL